MEMLKGLRTWAAFLFFFLSLDSLVLTEESQVGVFHILSWRYIIPGERNSISSRERERWEFIARKLSRK